MLLAHLKVAGTVEVAHSHHPVVVQPPQVARKEHPFVGFIDFQGLKIDVENRKGDYRHGKDKDGHEWKCLMAAHYGEVRDTLGRDNDPLDCYIGPNHDSSLVVVVRQHKPNADGTPGVYDEDKCFVGCDTVDEAVALYKKQYDRPGFYKEGDYLAMPIGRFWRWVHDERKQGAKVAETVPADPENQHSLLKGIVAGGAGAVGLHKSQRFVTGRENLYHGGPAGVADRVRESGLQTRAQLNRPSGITEAFTTPEVNAASKDLAFATTNKQMAKSYARQHSAAAALRRDYPDLSVSEALKNVRADHRYAYDLHMAPVPSDSVAHMRVPLWKLRKEGKLVKNPELEHYETEAGKLFDGMDGGRIKDFLKARVTGPMHRAVGEAGGNYTIRGGVGTEYVPGSKNFKRLGARELGEYATTHPGRFGGGLALAGLGVAGLGYGGHQIFKAIQDQRAANAAKTAAMVHVPPIPSAAPEFLGYALAPWAQKGLLGAAGLGVAGAFGAGVHHDLKEEERTGMPSIRARAGIGLGLGAGAGALAGYGLLRGKNVGVNRVLGGVARSSEMLMNVVREMRGQGLDNAAIRAAVASNPGLRQAREAAHLGHQTLQLDRMLSPGRLIGGGAAAGGLYGAGAGALVGKAHKDRVTELADALRDDPAEKTAYIMGAKEPSEHILRSPTLGHDVQHRVVRRYGLKKSEEEPTPHWKALLGGGLVGAVTVGAQGLGPMGQMLGHGASLREAAMMPLVAGGVGAALGVGGGALLRHLDANNIEEWRRARSRGPDALDRKAKKDLKEHRDLAIEEMGDMGRFERWRHGRDIARAQKYNAVQDAELKTAEHVAEPNLAAVIAGVRPVLVNLLALYQLYYFAHWTSKGDNAYGDHQLFERLYNGTQKEFDGVAERLVGIAGEQALDGVFPASAAKNEYWKTQGAGDRVASALLAERDLQATVLDAYRALDADAGLTLGLDDLLMQLASSHESNAYLLRQRAAGAKTGSAHDVDYYRQEAREHAQFADESGHPAAASRASLVDHVERQLHAEQRSFPPDPPDYRSAAILGGAGGGLLGAGLGVGARLAGKPKASPLLGGLVGAAGFAGLGLLHEYQAGREADTRYARRKELIAEDAARRSADPAAVRRAAVAGVQQYYKFRDSGSEHG